MANDKNDQPEPTLPSDAAPSSAGTEGSQKPVYYRKQPYYSKQRSSYGGGYGGGYGGSYGGGNYYGGAGYGGGNYYGGAGYGGGYYGGPYGGQQQEDEEAALGSMDPARILRVCLKKLPVLLNILLLSAVAAWAYYQAMPVVYSATGLVEMSVRGRRIMASTSAIMDDNASLEYSEEIFNTRLAKLKSRDVQSQAISRFRRDYPRLQISDADLANAIRNVNLALKRRTRLVEITAISIRAELAAALVNVYADTASQHAMDENKAISDNAVFWLNAQADAQRKLLEKADQAIVDFMAKNQLDSLTSQKSAADASLMTYNTEVVAVENEVARAVDMMKSLEVIQTNPQAIGSMPESVPRSSEIALVLSRLQSAKAEYDSLLVRYTDKHPLVNAKEKEIAVIQQQFAESAKRAHETAAANLDLLRKASETLRWKKEEQLKLGGDLDLKIKAVEMKLEQLQREKEANTMSYRGILNRIQEARLAQDENTATIKIVEKAEIPKNPMNRWLIPIMIFGLLIGVVVGVAVVLMLDKLEDKIISPADIEKRMRMKILALLPHVVKTTREQLALTVATKKFSQVSEAFAGLRALLESPRYQEINRCVLVISTQPEEGKTITVCNLALSYAQSGLKTLLVDFDMRRPRIARIFGVVEKAKASLLHVLEKGDPAMFSQLPVETEYERLHVVVSKAAEEISPADIMGRQSVKDFVEWAKANYDRVIIDSPPFGLVSDSVVLGQLAGAVFVVCRLGRSKYHPIVHAVREFRHADCKVIGAIINDVRYRSGDNHYDYRRY
jgi:succinoglycan biosynthesis transport protein ExoP